MNKSDSVPAIWVVIANGGVGSRFGSTGPKQYALAAGKTIFEWSLGQFTQRADLKGIVIASHVNDPYLAEQSGLDDSRIVLVDGGSTRAHSVLNALKALQGRAAQNEWVLVHDVARPLVAQSDIDALIASCITYQEGGILASPVPDTLKRVDSDRRISATVIRECIWSAQTPQCFQFGVLLKAIEDAQSTGIKITDESSAMEIQGYPVRVVEGSRDNIKVTFPEDLAFVTWVLEGRVQ